MPRLSSRSASLATVRHLHPRGSLKKRAMKSTSLRYPAPLNHAPPNHGPPSHGPTNNESNAHVTHRLGVRWIKRPRHQTPTSNHNIKPRHQTRHQTRHESRHESRPTRARAACAPRDPPEEGAPPSPPLSRSPPFGLADVAEKSPPDASDTSDARPDCSARSSSGNLGKPWEALGSLGNQRESAGISGKQRETLRWTQPSPARGASHVA